MTAMRLKSAKHDAPRVLFFAPSECLPANTGARLRNYHLAGALAAEARVTWLSFRDESEPHSAMADLARVCERVITIPREGSYSLSKILRGAAGRWPITVLNYTTREMATRLTALLSESDFDVVQIESVLLMAYLPILRAASSRPLVVCDWHNIDSEVLERYSRHAPSLARSLYARATAVKLRRLERRALDEFDAHFTVSERDRARLAEIARGARVFVANNGVDSGYYSDESCDRAHRLWPGREEASAAMEEPKRNRVLFAGSMDYFANVDAVVWFAREVWPDVRERYPGLAFTIAGRNPGEEVRALGRLPGVEVTGTVDDLRPYYREAAAAIVPLRIGGGSRLKILEAMAAGIPVVSTSLGAEGIQIAERGNILLADAAVSFRDSLIEVIEDQNLRRQLTASGRGLVREHYDWRVVGSDLIGAYRSLMHDGSMKSASLAEVVA